MVTCMLKPRYLAPYSKNPRMYVAQTKTSSQHHQQYIHISPLRPYTWLQRKFSTQYHVTKFNMATGKILIILLRTYLCKGCVMFWILVAMSKDCIVSDGGLNIFCWNCTMLAYSMRLECMHSTSNLYFFWVLTCALCLKVSNNDKGFVSRLATMRCWLIRACHCILGIHSFTHGPLFLKFLFSKSKSKGNTLTHVLECYEYLYFKIFCIIYSH